MYHNTDRPEANAINNQNKSPARAKVMQSIFVTLQSEPLSESIFVIGFFFAAVTAYLKFGLWIHFLTVQKNESQSEKSLLRTGFSLHLGFNYAN